MKKKKKMKNYTYLRNILRTMSIQYFFVQHKRIRIRHKFRLKSFTMEEKKYLLEGNVIIPYNKRLKCTFL